MPATTEIRVAGATQPPKQIMRSGVSRSESGEVPREGDQLLYNALNQVVRKASHFRLACSIARPLGCSAARLLGCKAARLQGCKAARLL